MKIKKIALKANYFTDFHGAMRKNDYFCTRIVVCIVPWGEVLPSDAPYSERKNY